MDRTNPEFALAKDLYEGMFGTGAYEQKWNSLSPLTRLWMTIQGFHPGGRKGAPPLRKEA